MRKYNFDVLIAVGYSVNSYETMQFRIWTTQILKEYLINNKSPSSVKRKSRITV